MMLRAKPTFLAFVILAAIAPAAQCQAWPDVGNLTTANMAVGKRGHSYSLAGRVLQVIDDRSMLVGIEDGDGTRGIYGTVVMLKAPTRGLVDGKTFRGFDWKALTGQDILIVSGTTQYRTVLGGSRTVFVLEAYVPTREEVEAARKADEAWAARAKKAAEERAAEADAKRKELDNLRATFVAAEARRATQIREVVALLEAGTSEWISGAFGEFARKRYAAKGIEHKFTRATSTVTVTWTDIEYTSLASAVTAETAKKLPLGTNGIARGTVSAEFHDDGKTLAFRRLVSGGQQQFTHTSPPLGTFHRLYGWQKVLARK